MPSNLPEVRAKLTPAQVEALRAAARKVDQTLSEFLRSALAAHVALHQVEWPEEDVAPQGNWLKSQQGKIVIDVSNMDARVARWKITGEGGYLEDALNADELADQAAEAVEAMGGHLEISGQYPCPDELKAKAIFA